MGKGTVSSSSSSGGESRKPTAQKITSATRKRAATGESTRKSTEPKRANMQQAALFVFTNHKMCKISTDPMAPTVLPIEDVVKMRIDKNGTSHIFTGWIFNAEKKFKNVRPGFILPSPDYDYAIWCEKQPTKVEVRAAAATCSHGAVYAKCVPTCV